MRPVTSPPAREPFGRSGQYDESGVDLSLIRANLRVTPTERARRAEREERRLALEGGAAGPEVGHAGAAEQEEDRADDPVHLTIMT